MTRSETAAGPAPACPAGSTDGRPAPLLRIDGLSAGFGPTPVLESLSLTVEAGRTLVVLGESGCGKTTLLKAIAGLTPISGGEIRLGSRRIDGLSPRDRGVVYLDQEPLLFEHLTVYENVAFPLRLRRVPDGEVRGKVDAALRAIGLEGHAPKREWQLSGGQKQRVAFARAVIAAPTLLLLDEPFGSLDNRTRGQMQALFAELARRHALTSVFVTHDVKEALVVGDRFGRMAGGALRLYPDRAGFVNDRDTGVLDEVEFWRRSADLLREPETDATNAGASTAGPSGRA